MIDLSVIQLLEENKLKKSNFILTENYHIRLKPNTAKLLIEKIRSNFNSKVPYKKRNFTYQNILYDNISQLAQYISNKKKTIEFTVPHVMINRNDDLLIREKVLSMSPDERRKLRINKSTLWYMKKNLKNNKSFKIYNKILTNIQ